MVLKPSSDSFLRQVELSSRSVSLAIQALEKSDHIEHTKEGYRAIDPVTKHILST
ncbi:MAG: hypothetical protein JSR46_01750 [Verrucomicrobia bacterium]|nr:hypothetical protein [Verrucomicrobiota bacterium]